MSSENHQLKFDDIPDTELQFFFPLQDSKPIHRAHLMGAITWLWFNSSLHTQWPVALLNANTCTAVELQQFCMVRHRSGVPLMYASWAMLDEQRELQYLRDPVSLKPEDWNSGDRMWFIDWIAPFGGSLRIASIMRKKIFPHGNAWALRVGEDKSVARIMSHFGRDFPKDQQREQRERMKTTFSSI